MRVRRGAVAAVLACALIGAAGCSGPDDPGPSTLPSLSATPSVTPSAAPVDIPVAARAMTPAGAAAFVRFYYDQLNRAYKELDGSTVESLSDPTCKTCANYVGDIAAAKRDGTRFQGGGFIVKVAEAAGDQRDPVVVDVVYDSPPLQIVDQGGKVITSKPARLSQRIQFQVGRSAGGWKALRVIRTSP